MSDPKNMTRRSFFGITAGTVGAAASVSLMGCNERMPRYLVPEVSPSDDTVPGIASYFRTVCRGCSAGCGMTARVREGRAVKVEGNTQHPVSRGALCLRGQAAIEELYSPDRLAKAAMAGKDVDWPAAQKALADGLGKALAAGKQIVLVTRPETGALGDLLRAWLTALGQSPDQVVTFDAAEPVWLREAALATFGVAAQPVWSIGKAHTLLSIGSDFLEDWGSPVEHARDLANLRAAKDAGRFVYVGPRLSTTAAAADAYHALRPGAELAFVLALLHEVLALEPHPAGVDEPTLRQLQTLVASHDPGTVPGGVGMTPAALRDLAKELLQARPGLAIGPGRVAAGADAVALTQAVYLLNVAIGAYGKTLQFFDPSTAPSAGPSLSHAEFAKRAKAGQIGAVLVHQCNPLGLQGVFADLAAAIGHVPFVAVLGNRMDETARKAQIVLADHHFLESWGEVDPRPGVHGLQQPVMMPVHDTRAAADVLIGVARQLGKATGLPDEETFAAYQRNRVGDADVERGGVFSEAAPRALTLTATAVASVAQAKPSTLTGNVLLAAPSLRFIDGRPPVSALVAEVPDPLTTIAWSGWVELHPDAAKEQGIVTGDVLKLTTARGALQLPAFLTPAVAQGVIAVPLAYATDLLGGSGSLTGLLGAVQVARTGQHLALPMTGGSLDDQGRDLAREVDAAHPNLPKAEALPTIQDPEQKGKHRWALAIDLDRCNGCGACVAACHVENNVPVVGASLISRGRAMSWIRVQRYFSTHDSVPRVVFLPSMCQQCGSAPCETVCPAYATYHTADGLNAQVYNRCVGTRYCSNNCPYVARRFNWFQWPHPKPANLGLNPDVTVRERGVMEKCTFCVQRIRDVQERAKVAGEPVPDGAIQPACAQTCAPEALVFGDLNDPSSRVAKLSQSGRAYHLLEELGTRPGVTYLARRRKENT